MWGALYIVASCAQILAIIDSIPTILDVPFGITLLVSFVIAEIPVVGTVAGVYGAVVNWNLPAFVALMLFIWPIVILTIYFLRFRPKDPARETAEPTASEKEGSDGVVISHWMANVLKEQVEQQDKVIEGSVVDEPIERDVTESLPEAPAEDDPSVSENDGPVIANAEPAPDAEETVKNTKREDAVDEIVKDSDTDYKEQEETEGEKPEPENPAISKPGPTKNQNAAPGPPVDSIPEKSSLATLVAGLLRDRIDACITTVLERTGTTSNTSFRRSLNNEVPDIMCTLGLILIPELKREDIARDVLGSYTDEKDETVISRRFDGKREHYQSALSDGNGYVGSLVSRRVGRTGDGLLIRIVDDAVADCRAAILALEDDE